MPLINWLNVFDVYRLSRTKQFQKVHAALVALNLQVSLSIIMKEAYELTK